MLSLQDNDILCRVGPGTPMGELMRQYWIPALLASELEADGYPRRIRLLSEDLIAFRDTDGRVGVIQENCPHRGSSMMFGRNEENGLRCVYHGWKFDVDGACVDMPSEGSASDFKHKVKMLAYRTQERNGIVWLYMGPRAKGEEPPLPDLEVNLDGFPRRAGEPFKYVRQCNWAQALEGDIDSVHLNFLHTRLDRPNPVTGSDTNPHFDLIYTDYGHFYGARRTVGDKYYWRINQFAMPFYTAVTGPTSKVWMPIDDENTLIMEWNPSRPPDMPREYDDTANMATARQPWGYKPDDPRIPWGNWRLKADVDNEWLRDRSLEDRFYIGIYSNPLQDSAVQVTMGAVYDRTREYLGTTDKAIIAFRRIMIQAAKAFRDGGELPPTVDNAALYRQRGFAAMLPKDVDWLEASKPWREAFSDGPPPEYRVDLAALREGRESLAPRIAT